MLTLIISQIQQNLTWVNEEVLDLKIPDNFEVAAPAHDDSDPPPSRKQRNFPQIILITAPFYVNPQTEAFCRLLEIDGSKMPR